jgi:hypothetical protein
VRGGAGTTRRRKGRSNFGVNAKGETKSRGGRKERKKCCPAISMGKTQFLIILIIIKLILLKIRVIILKF